MSERWEVRQGDALELLRQLPDQSVDALITDPPYSSGGFTRGDRMADPAAKYVQSGVELIRASFAGDNRDARSWCYWMALWLSEVTRVLVDGGYALVFCDWRQLPLATDAMQSGGLQWRGVVAWDKGRGARAPHVGYFRHQAEFVVWGTAGPLAPTWQDGPWDGVMRVPVLQSDKFHMTGKPSLLMENLAVCCPPGGLILDTFCGSGSTGVGALRAGRRFLGFEREAHNCEISRQRLATEQAQGRIFEPSNDPEQQELTA